MWEASNSSSNYQTKAIRYWGKRRKKTSKSLFLFIVTHSQKKTLTLRAPEIDYKKKGKYSLCALSLVADMLANSKKLLPLLLFFLYLFIWQQSDEYIRIVIFAHCQFALHCGNACTDIIQSFNGNDFPILCPRKLINYKTSYMPYIRTYTWTSRDGNSPLIVASDIKEMPAPSPLLTSLEIYWLKIENTQCIIYQQQRRRRVELEFIHLLIQLRERGWCCWGGWFWIILCSSICLLICNLTLMQG